MSFNKHDLTINLALQQDGPWTYQYHLWDAYITVSFHMLLLFESNT